MYLRGLGGIVVRMPDGNQREFSAISTDLENAILAGGVPLRPNGSAYSVSKFMGGWLFDNCPLNVILGQGWISGQQEALAAAGLVPTCPQLGPVAAASAPPTFTQIAAPGFTQQTTTPSGARILPTGVATATAPQIIMLPGGTPAVLPAEPAETEAAAPAPSMAGGLALGLGALALVFLTSRKKRG